MKSSEIDSFKEDFYHRFNLPNGYQSFVATARYLNTLKAPRRFDLLFSVLCDHHETPFPIQKVASGLLLKQAAKCSKSLSDVIYPVLDKLDASIQEYPFFLAKLFGVDQVMEEIRRLKSADLSTRQLKGLSTFEYWLSGFSDKRYEELRHRWSRTICG